MELEEIKRRKKELGISFDTLSEKSGVSLTALKRIFYGKTQRPHAVTMEAIETVLSPGYLNKNEVIAESNTFSRQYGSAPEHACPYQVNVCVAENVCPYYNNQDSPVNPSTLKAAPFPLRNHTDSMISENMSDNMPDNISGNIPDKNDKSTPLFPRQGSYQLEDYFNLEEKRNIELIDGIFYSGDTPSMIHQTVVFEIGHQIQRYIAQTDMPCLTFVSPEEVQLNGDERTLLKPDVSLICDPSRLSKNRIIGAPDFLVEVISPATSLRDHHLKYRKYFEAGVKEYWLIDTEQERILTFLFRQAEDGSCADEIKIYTFDDQVPVEVLDAKLKVDFSKIKEPVHRVRAELTRAKCG